jgi:lipopolysaccharide/colanic/teichoic acid biosynthesis glycosyltransferase
MNPSANTATKNIPADVPTEIPAEDVIVDMPSDNADASAQSSDANNNLKTRDSVSMNEARSLGAYKVVKRLCDILFSVLVIAIMFIPTCVIAVMISAESHGSPIYTSHRVGKNGKKIRVLKLRTMVADSNNLEKYLTPEQIQEWHCEHKVHDDPRITKIGRFLRKTSLDELPQFLNVLAGTMSVVGPRPITVEELGWFTDEEREQLLSAVPGITGLWQVSGRNDISFQSGERQNTELYYVEHASFMLDTRIFFRTFKSLADKTGR